ncbi:hypothetical protein DUI87_24275 [Hirundo rustica rustica]|uniref:Uncharacterized protein n=1 Tax=Hirundo rustica rustica TaxID=333673 RepID=A0A3M0JFC4_HIRRU|nr:hypothetical protein DUI87_24275 [Hirundo rustica rustica]
MKLVFMGPEAFNFRKCVNTSGFNPAGLQGEMQSSLLCLDRQAAIWTAGQMFMVLEKGSTSGKVDHSRWEVDRIVFCVFLEADYKIFKKKMGEFFPLGYDI